MSFLAGFILGLFVGGFLGLLVFCLLTQAKRGDQLHARTDSDPYAISERMSRRARALERAGIEELQGHPRLGVDHVERGAARLTPPTP